VRTIVKGKNYEVPDRVRQYAERKLERLGRFLDDRTDATVELSMEAHRSVADSHIVEVTLVIDGQTLRGKASAPTHRAGIDQVLDKIERRAVDFKEKPRAHIRGESAAGTPVPTTGADTGRPTRVVKVKRFAIEPMFEEDALTRMEELGHSFFVFVNAENERVGILYRRDDGSYGLIEPVVGGEYTKGKHSRNGGKNGA
jgi:putative sigma-54 modulation protein